MLQVKDMHCILTYKEGSVDLSRTTKKRLDTVDALKATLRYALTTINSIRLSKAQDMLLIAVQEQKKRNCS